MAALLLVPRLRRRAFRPTRWLRLCAAAWMLLGCEDPGAAECAGIVIDDECVAPCDPSLCVEGNTCVANQCVLTCASHRDCRPDQSCLTDVEDGTDAEVHICRAHGRVGLLADCPLSDECADPLTCVSRGPGDADAYCTDDCLVDGDCADGFYCGVVRDPRRICGTTKGNNAICGTTDAACVEPTQLSADGPIVEGSVCILRRACLIRDVCAPCVTDLDCSYAGVDCIDVGGEPRCAAACARDSDCSGDNACAGGHCVPRFGACAGEGGGFCEPCLDDRDCGGAETGWACFEYRFGQKACVDFGTPCTSSTECPVAPSGEMGSCYNGWRYGTGPFCGPPYDVDTRFPSCW